MILLDHAPFTPFDTPRTARPPGLSPMGDWIVVHDDFAAQMAYRGELLNQHRDTVLNVQAEAVPATHELYDALLSYLDGRDDFQVRETDVTRPDGVQVSLDPARPLESLNRLVAEDWCIMQQSEGDDEYRLTAAILCFPSRWLLAEKIGHPLTIIHDPVPDYDESLARRVNRVFQAIQPDRPLVRCNWLVHGDPELFRPLGRNQPDQTREEPVNGLFLRTERQTLVRLPKTHAVVFGIKSSVTPLERLTATAARALRRELSALSPETLDYSERGPAFSLALQQLSEQSQG